MNEVSFRDSVLDSIDTIVTESSNDVLFSLLDTADKAMMIMENCTDTDDIWKYSIWQEADGNAEQIDKDKHPFKENSTLKTILMLPINLIKFIFKTISQAFSPQKAQESSKLAAVAEKSKNVVQKILPFFFTEEGELNTPIVIGAGAGTAGLTLDAIIRKNHSVIVTIVNKIRDLFSKAIRALKQMRGEDVPDQFTFTASKSDSSKYDTCLDFEKAGTYLDEMGKLFDGLSTKIKEIKDAPEEKNKIAKSNALVSEIKKATNLCPIYKSIKTYSTTEIAAFYNTASEKTQKFAKQEAVNTFINEYKTSIADNNKTQKVIANVSQALGRSFAVYNAFISAVQGINDINDAINKAIGEVVRQVPDPNAPVTTGEQPQQSAENNNNDQDNEQYEEVTDKSKAPDGFPTGYFTKDSDGKYVAVANDATWDTNTTYYKKKADTTNGEESNNNASPANNDNNAAEEEPKQPEEGQVDTNTTENPTEESSPAVDQNGPKTLTAEDALALIKTNHAYKDRNVYIEKGVIKYNKRPFVTKPIGLAVSVDGKQRRLKVKVDDGKTTYVLEYAAEDEEPIDPVVAAWYNK